MIMEDVEKLIEERVKLNAEKKEIEQTNSNSPSVPYRETEKSIGDVGLHDIKIQLDSTKAYTEQAEDVVGAMSTAKAIEKKEVQEQLIQKKGEELVNKAEAKASKAKEQKIGADTAVAEAKRDLYSTVLQSFGIYKHLPDFLMTILVCIFSPIYVVLSLLIGVPCGFVKVLIDNLDGIIVRYQKTEDKTKPKIKTIVWILLGLLVILAICLTVLKCLNKI